MVKSYFLTKESLESSKLQLNTQLKFDTLNDRCSVKEKMK